VPSRGALDGLQCLPCNAHFHALQFGACVCDLCARGLLRGAGIVDRRSKIGLDLLLVGFERQFLVARGVQCGLGAIEFGDGADVIQFREFDSAVRSETARAVSFCRSMLIEAVRSVASEASTSCSAARTLSIAILSRDSAADSALRREPSTPMMRSPSDCSRPIQRLQACLNGIAFAFQAGHDLRVVIRHLGDHIAFLHLAAFHNQPAQDPPVDRRINGLLPLHRSKRD
jgi:hypothetical protein